MSYKKAALLYSVAFLLQFSLMNLFSVFGVSPNLILCLMLFITYRYNEGYRYALLFIPFALLSDLIGGQYVGVGALSLFVLCLLTTYFGRDLNRDTLWTLVTVSAIGTAGYYFLYWLVMMALGNPGTVLGLLKFLALALPMNLVVVLIVFLVHRRVNSVHIRHTGYAMVDMGTAANKRNKRNKKRTIRNVR
jgi:rod shape-determining protein MreD